MKHFLFTLAVLLCIGLPGISVSAGQAAPAPAAPPAAGQQKKATTTPYATALKDATVIGTGCVTAYSKDDHTLIDLPENLLGRLLLWYSEAVRLPPTAVSAGGINMGGGDSRGTTAVTLERQGKRIFIRDHSPGFSKRGGSEDPVSFDSGTVTNPIDHSVSEATNGPIIAVLPIVGEGPDKTILVDITEAFSKDIESLTARAQIVTTGLIPAAVDPARSYIAGVRVFPTDIDIRSHLTFLAADPNNPISGPQPVSIEIGHSIILLPEKPMQARYFDDRVGFFKTKFTEYETSEGAVVNNRAVILRRRLEKKNPDAEVSDPVEPIVFYIGRGVPDRWRPYMKAAVEQWQPVFEAAGFSNAIIAKDAPTEEEDPSWSAEDVRHSVIRWIPQSLANAMGPVTYDPRSGEILSSHILVWPEVIDIFQRYYYAVAGTLDPEAASLPLSEQKQGELLTYLVSHEVGHTLGLRHNHLGSTAYTVAEMRDPNFANSHGPNTSIMAYGRFNQCAQPGDGISQLYSIHGSYDYFAIDWGYGVHATTRQEEQDMLNSLAAAAEKDRSIAWGAGEMPDETAWAFDPRMQKENTGAERVEATKLGVANVLRSLSGLNRAVGNDDKLFAQTWLEMLEHQFAYLDSVKDLVAGQLHLPGHIQGLKGRLIPAARQREAVQYLLSDGVLSLDAYKKADVLYRAAPIGGVRTVEQFQAILVKHLLDGTRLALMEEQKSVDPTAYGVIDLADDMTAALWGDLSTASRTQRVMQAAFLDTVKTIVHPSATDPGQAQMQITAMKKAGFPAAFIGISMATGARTSLPAWACATLPELQKRLENAKGSNRSDQLHFQEMARKIQGILNDQSEKTALKNETPTQT
jgi:hypothetical protein